MTINDNRIAEITMFELYAYEIDNDFLEELTIDFRTCYTIYKCGKLPTSYDEILYLNAFSEILTKTLNFNIRQCSIETK